MTVYATEAQLLAFTGESTAPTGVTRLLARASEVIDQALRTAVYTVDTDGAPTDATVALAMANATCAQIEFWLASDEEDDILGPIQGVFLAGMTIQQGIGKDRVSMLYLAPRAHRILLNAGLRDGQPTHI